MPAVSAHFDPALVAVTDFPERLSPLVVKELRRALRSMYFVWPFVLLPAALGVTDIWVMMREGDREAHGVLSLALWYGVVVPFFILKPVQALVTIRRERANRTLDLLLLSGLSPIRIITGKWLSLEVQSLLFLVALLPFFLLRYFFGHVELLHVAFALGVTLAGAAFVTVLCLAISTFGRIAFGCCTAGMVFFTPLWMLPTVYLGMVIEGTDGSSLSLDLIPMLILVAVVASFLGFVALGIASANIAPLPRSPCERGALPRPLLQRTAPPPPPR